MRAFIVPHMGAGLDACRIADVEPPGPSAGGLRVRVRAAAANPADLKLIRGEFTGRFLHAREAPAILGYDFAGVVQGASEGFTAGEEVCGFLPYAAGTRGGTLAEWVVVRPDQTARIPPGVSAVDAACLATAGCTALQALRDKLRVTEGQRVLVNGASGGVGVFGVQIARLLGATVVATCGESKREAVEALGAKEVFDYRSTSVHDLPGPFDAVFDAAATLSLGACAHRMTPTGRYVTTLPGLGLLTSVVRAAFSSRSAAFLTVQPLPSDLAQLCAWVASGAIRVPKESVALADAATAYQMLEGGKLVGKVGISVA